MATQQGRALRLVDYLVLVGPEQKKDEAVLSYCDVSEAVILRQFPRQCRNDCCVCIKQAPFFCQPQGRYSLEENEIKYHTFMLTDTETNKSLYGVCYTFPHETKSHDTANVAKETVLLSVCLLSQHFYLNFFQSCLEALASLVEKSYTHITWQDLFYPGPANTASNASSTGVMGDIENWIDKLLNLELPATPGTMLEVMVDLGPPLMLSHPLPNEWPSCSLSVRQLFQHLQPHTVNETLQLILNEQKVVICSSRHDIVSSVVFTLVSLLYPLEYVYPVIPLLPARLNQAAENLLSSCLQQFFLMVPVPYIIGVTTDLISELSPVNLEDVYVIDIDAKKIKNPQVVEGLPRLPFNSLELQANIKKILDSVQPFVQVKGSLVIVDYQDKERIDMLIRQAFLDFMMSPQMLGLLPRHQTIVRLFPRSVIRLQSSCLLQEYNQLLPHENTSFIEKFITSQSIQCFLDWNLNPTNTVYLQYRQSVSGKPTSELWSRNRERVGVSLVEPDSIVYQLLLSSASGTDDCTDSSSDEEEHQCLLSSWNDHQCSPNMVLPELRLTKPIATTPKIKISDHYATCQQWMEKLLEGRSILYMKTQHKQVLASDSGRTELLLLIERGLLGDREASEVLWNSKPLEISSIVFNKLLHLAKSMVKNIDKDFSKNPHCHLTSAVILLRLSCLVCLKTVPLTNRKPSNDELTMLKSPVLSCGDNTTPFVSSVSSYTSSSDEDDVGNDLCAEARSSPSTVTNKFPSHDNNKFLHHDLFIKTSSHCACLANDEFWKTVFFSAVNMLRDKLGWNEKTPELYQRYLSVGSSGQQEMAEEENELLTSVLINLATFMSVTGMCEDKCRQLVTNLVMYCRLGHRCDTIVSTLKERMRRKDTGIAPLCINKPIIFVAHLGRNKQGIACNVEVWERVLVLRRISDNEITLRVWRNAIGTSLCDTHGELVVLHYKDDNQPPIVLHTKQFHQLHETIIT